MFKEKTYRYKGQRWVGAKARKGKKNLGPNSALPQKSFGAELAHAQEINIIDLTMEIDNLGPPPMGTRKRKYKVSPEKLWISLDVYEDFLQKIKMQAGSSRVGGYLLEAP